MEEVAEDKAEIAAIKEEIKQMRLDFDDLSKAFLILNEGLCNIFNSVLELNPVVKLDEFKGGSSQ